ncbi:ran-specific GTPase-activating protein 2 [Aspergillus udagawae]|uniref:Ran-specific GTPase-activating protein 2 n=1 Tax=Aspergillus udagawae TaxID=91492 RepID=A0ABQ1AFL1_9EURO|nr:ran-specific GTPase-activating protein 2 [Aspergillus udagawae]
MASDLQPAAVMEGEIRKEEETGKTQGTTAEDSQASDNEGTERPVRQKLKETSIASTQQEKITKNGEEATDAKVTSTTDAHQPADINDTMELGGGSNSRSSSRGRKRSFDDDEAESDGEEHGHRRKRSRDSTSEGDEQPPRSENSLPRKVLSPKKKRSRDKLDGDESGERATEKTDTKTEKVESEGKPESEGQPEKKRHRDNSTERKPAPVTSAFANTSAVSPFGSLGASKSKEEEPTRSTPVTSTSAFASSSLAAFAGSEQSPFGSLGASTPSVFKSPAASESEKPAATGFAAGASTSGFAALGSGFSGFSGAFGAAAKTGGLTSFASPTAPSTFGSSTKDKPFGAADADEEEEEEDEAETGPKEFEAEKPDERFFERQIETGEEQEKTYFSGKAKLFQFTNKEWKERGIGTFKVNVKVTEGQEDKKAARMIMRADGVLRVMLNTPLFKGMKVGDPSGNEPNSKQIHLVGVEDGRTVPLLLRVGSEDAAKELYHVIQDLLQHQ